MRDRYLGLVLAFVAWMIVPISVVRGADASDPIARAATASDVQATLLASERSVERKSLPSSGACELANPILPTTSIADAAIADVAGIARAPHATLDAAAQPRGPPV